jgi:hypothetical protein
LERVVCILKTAASAPAPRLCNFNEGSTDFLFDFTLHFFIDRHEALVGIATACACECAWLGNVRLSCSTERHRCGAFLRIRRVQVPLQLFQRRMTGQSLDVTERDTSGARLSERATPKAVRAYTLQAQTLADGTERIIHTLPYQAFPAIPLGWKYEVRFLVAALENSLPHTPPLYQYGL